jgi:hypothetical protein
MFSRLCSSFLLLGAVTLAPSGAALADDEGAVKLLTTIPYPATLRALHAFDISWVDADTQLYYLGDRSNASVDVFDVKNNKFVRKISGGFKGVVFKPNGTGNNDKSGPNGVVVSGHLLFVTDAPSRVVAIDLRTDKIVGEVNTGGDDGNRADELAYDPEGGVILAVNNADDPPFATLINVDKSTGKLTLGKRITFKAFGPAADTATNGAEQPVWDRRTGMFYISIPELNGPGDGSGPDGAVAAINPKTAKVEATHHVSLCQPAGLTLGPNQDLLIGCSVVFDTAGKPWTATDPNSAAPTQVILDAGNGTVDRVVGGVGGADEVWFNRGDGRYYTAARNNPTGPVLGVIDAKGQSLVQIVPTVNSGGKANVFPSGTAHSVAVNPHNNHALVPLPANNIVPKCLNGCLAVYGTQEHDD